MATTPFSSPADRRTSPQWPPPWAGPTPGGPAHPGPPDPTAPPAQPRQAHLGAAELAQWLDRQQRQLTDPRQVENELRRSGWHPVHAAMEATRYRARFNEHPLGYSALLVATGIAALAAGTVGHVLVSGLDRGIDRNMLGGWLTILLVSLPFAIWAHAWAARVDRHDPVAVWSKSRRWLAQALVWGCGIVGIGRLAIYAGQLVGSLVGATWAAGDSPAVGVLNVAITISIALPLGLWAFHFLHRFDANRPARPGPDGL